jgi:hypothetical protein
MAQVFISYSRKDIDFVRKLAGDLESAGYDVWWDLSDLRGGDDWVNTIPAAIASSQYFIVVLTPAAGGSEWVRKEYTQALSLHKKVIPILLKPGSVPFALNTINFVNFTSGEYAERFQELLSALDFKGKPPEVTPYQRALLSLPPAFFRFGIPVLMGILLLLAFLASRDLPPTPPPDSTLSSTPTAIPSPIFTDTATPSASPTSVSTTTSTPTNTDTSTPTPSSTQTPTFTPTLSRAFSLPICIYYPYISGNWVRERPSNNTGSRELGSLQGDGTNCPFFSAYIVNEENEIWYQFASDGQKAEFKDYAGRWIFGHLPPAVSPKTLPLCIYSRSVGTVYVRDIPSDSNFNTIGAPLEADGTMCPFLERQDDGVWFQFAMDQRGKMNLFGDYAGGWISAEFLALPTTKLPVVTLTPTPTPSETLTITPTFTRTPTETPAPTETATETATETPTP